jgi:hypothetical protein
VRGELDSPPRVRKERDAELFLQTVHGARQRRLADTEFLSCVCEVFLTGNGRELGEDGGDSTCQRVPGQGCELTDGADAADEGRRPSPAAMAREAVVCTVCAQPDERCLTCGNPKMILTARKSDVHPRVTFGRSEGLPRYAILATGQEISER